MGESGARCVGMSGGNMAHRGRLLEEDADAATRGVFDGPFGLVFEHVELQAVTERPQKGTGQRAGVSMGADTRANTLRVAAHLRSEIIVSLRMAASAEAPSAPMRLHPILQSMGKVGAVRG